MEKVIPVIINGEPQLIDEAELRNICALENIPYDSPPPSVDPPKNVEPTSPLPKEVHSEPAQVPVPPPLSIVNSQPLTLIQSGNIIAVPISSQGIPTGDTILVTRPGQIEVLSTQSSDVIYSAEEIHIDPNQAIPEMIKLAPSGQKEDLVIANESTINAEKLPQSEYSPVNGLQGIGAAGAEIVLNPKSTQQEICELILHYKGCMRHRVIVPYPSSQTDFSEVTQQTRRLFGEKELVYVITGRKLVATSPDNQLDNEANIMGAVASINAPQLEADEETGETQAGQVGEAQVGQGVALQVAQPIQVGQSQNIYLRTTAGQTTLVSPTQMVVRPTTTLIMPTTPVSLGQTVGQALILPSANVVTSVVGGQMYQITPIANENKVLVQVPNQTILPKAETPKQAEDPLKISNGIKDTSGGGKPEEQNQLVEVFYAHCDHCGHNSRELKVCQKCRRPLPKDAKITSQKILPVVASRNPEEYCLSVRCNSCNLISTDLKHCYHCKNPISEGATRSYIRLGTKELSKVEVPKKKKCQRKKKVEEPVTLSLLSSDEEDGDNASSKNLKLPDISDKEPIITNETVSPCSESRIEGGGLDLADIITSTDVERALLQCRTVRIGSYKTVPEGKVAITEYGLYIKVPSLETKEMVTVKIFKNEIVKILGNFGKTVPVLFYYTTAKAAEKIRRILQMSPPDQHRGPYYDPTSTVEMHRRITLLPEKISEETRLFLKCTYNNQCLLENLSIDEANSILIKASPSEAPVENAIQTPNRGKDNFMQTPNSGPNSSTAPAASNAPIQAIMVYPPPPAKGGISINTEDYGCLGEDNFLNDVIIDFYLKYFVQTQLSPEDQQRTHVFSSFFYKRLTTKIPPRPDDKHSAAERRHTRVRSWTKHVDLFSKDFIIIPINENSHWFLGVVCFPGLTQAVRISDGKPVANPSKRRETGVPQMIGGTTITRVSQEPMTITIEPDEEDRDEADADDDDLEPNTSDEEPCEEPEEGSELLDDATHPVPKLKVKKEPQEPIKQPCILIFDSLAGASRSKVCATLREYLQVEYNVRHRNSKGKREINKNTMRASVVKVPQQTNYTDCGLYVLQYTEAFFQSPITDYRMPIKQLVDWFDTTIVSKKRYQIQQLLHKLMEQQNVDTARLNLPQLNLHPEGTGKVYHDEDEEEMPEDMEDMDFEDMEEDEEMMGEEEEDEEMAAEFHRKMVANPSTLSGNSTMSSNAAVASGNTQSTPGEDIRARLQRRELTISSSIASSIGNSVSITTATSTSAPSPSKPALQPTTISGTPFVPPTISLSRKIVPDSSTTSPSKTPQHSSHSKYEHLSITSTTVGSSGAKRKVTSTSLKDVRIPPRQPSLCPSTPNRSVDIKKVRTE